MDQEREIAKASPAEKPASRFTLQKLADLDEMTEFREAAKDMPIDGCFTLSAADADKMARAIVEKYGERTVRIKSLPEGWRLVIRCEQRQPKERKPRAPKAPAKVKKGKSDG